MRVALFCVLSFVLPLDVASASGVAFASPSLWDSLPGAVCVSVGSPVGAPDGEEAKRLDGLAVAAAACGSAGAARGFGVPVQESPVGDVEGPRGDALPLADTL